MLDYKVFVHDNRLFFKILAQESGLYSDNPYTCPETGIAVKSVNCPSVRLEYKDGKMTVTELFLRGNEEKLDEEWVEAYPTDANSEACRVRTAINNLIEYKRR